MMTPEEKNSIEDKKAAAKAKALADIDRAFSDSGKSRNAKSSALTGLTKLDCALDCNLNHCVITHAGICGHPHKGGLQPIFQMDPGCVERYRQAKILLEQQRIQEM